MNIQLSEYFKKVVNGSPVISDAYKEVLIQNESSLDDKLKENIIETILAYEKAVSLGIDEFLKNQAEKNENVSHSVKT